MKISFVDLETKREFKTKVADFNKLDYCIHGKRFKDRFELELSCICCNAFVEKELESTGIKFCKFCFTNEVKMELL